MAFPSRKNAKRDFEKHLRSHEPRKEHICPFCKKKFGFKSLLQRHTETCRMKTKIQKLQNPKPKRKSKNEKIKSSTDTCIVKIENNDTSQKAYEKKSEVEKKELPIVIMKEEENDTPDITAQITAKLPGFILSNVSIPSKTVVFDIKTSNKQS